MKNSAWYIVLLPRRNPKSAVVSDTLRGFFLEFDLNDLISKKYASNHVKKPKLKVNGGGCQTHLRGVGPKGPTLKNFAVRRLSYNNCQR